MNTKNVSKRIISLAAGIIVFFVLLNLPLAGLEPAAQTTLAIYGLMIVWWCLEPIPWFATIIVPMLLFPIMGTMTLKEVVPAIIGDRILFFLIFIFLLAKVIERNGLGRRIAMNMLNIKWIHGNINRALLVFMCAVCLLEALFGVVGAIVSVPIAVSLIDHIGTECDRQNVKINKTRLGSRFILSAAYAHIAGGLITIQGVPQNIAVLSIFQEQTGASISYAQWLIPGLACAIPVLVVSYVVLRLMFPLEISEIPGGAEYFEREAKSLGKMRSNEKRLIVIMAIIIALWIAITFIKIPGIDFNWVAYLGLFLLFLIPTGDESGGCFLEGKDLKTLNWNVIFMVTVAVCFSSLLNKFGLIAWISEKMAGLNGLALLLIATFVSGLMTNLVAGMATAAAMTTLLIPLLMPTWIHPFVAVRVISIMTVGLMVPWAGTSAALFYGSQRLHIRDMSKSGIVMLLINGSICIAVNLLLMNIEWLYPAIG